MSLGMGKQTCLILWSSCVNINMYSYIDMHMCIYIYPYICVTFLQMILVYEKSCNVYILTHSIFTKCPCVLETLRTCECIVTGTEAGKINGEA